MYLCMGDQWYMGMMAYMTHTSYSHATVLRSYLFYGAPYTHVFLGGKRMELALPQASISMAACLERLVW
jgi:hypothetical protein